MKALDVALRELARLYAHATAGGRVTPDDLSRAIGIVQAAKTEGDASDSEPPPHLPSDADKAWHDFATAIGGLELGVDLADSVLAFMAANPAITVHTRMGRLAHALTTLREAAKR